MTNTDILKTAMRQSALDTGAQVSDFTKGENVLVAGGPGPHAKRYYKEPIACNFISYGGNIVASAKGEYLPIVKEYLDRFEYYHCFETPALHRLDDSMKEHGFRVCFMAEYFLPDVNAVKVRKSSYELRLLTQRDFKDLYTPEWSNALCYDRKELDVLGIGAYDKGRLIGLAACSADASEMWQIGIDVLPEYRRHGIASTLTGNLAYEILKRNKVPFYCCAWSNLISLKNALKSGFKPAWLEMTVKPAAMVEEMNR